MLSKISLPFSFLVRRSSSLLCVRVDIVVFSAVKYLAHEASVPGEPAADGSPGIVQWKLGTSVSWKLPAVLLPCAGLVGLSMVGWMSEDIRRHV